MNNNCAKYSNKTASALIASGRGIVYGVTINSHTTGSMKLWDSLTATGTVIINTYAYPTGSSTILFPAPIEFYTGLYATLTGTQDVTFIYAPN